MRDFKWNLVGAVLAVGLGSAQADTLVITGSEWCPYNCAMADSQPGYVVDIAKKVFEPAGHQVEYKVLPWARALRELEDGKANGLIGASKTEERVQKGYVFPQQTIGVAENVFFVKADDSWTFADIPSLEKLSVAVIRDYSYGDAFDAYLAANRSAGTKVQELSGDGALARNFEKVAIGRADTTIEDRAVGLYELKKLGKANAFKQAGGLGPDPIYVAFSPKDPKAKDYAALLDAGIVRMRADGSLKAILEAYGLSDWQN